MHTRLSNLAMFAIAALFATGCCHKTDKAAIETKIRQLDADWVKAAATHNVDAWTAFYTDDAVVLPPNEKTLTDKAAIHTFMGGLLGMPGVSLSWTEDKVVVADAGDMAYLYGSYKLSMPMPSGTMSDTGKVAEVWRKQSGGDWKCVLDMWSSDLPPAPTK